MAPNFFLLLSSALLMLSLLAGFGAAVPAVHQYDSAGTRHDWHECKHIHLSKRDHPDFIPADLPEDVLATRECNKVPEKYLDAHCGHVLWVVNDFCKHFAVAKVHAFVPHGEAGDVSPTVNNYRRDYVHVEKRDDPQGGNDNDLDIKVGPINYNSRNYIHGTHLNVYFQKNFDMFNITVESIPRCVTDRVDLGRPESGLTCEQMLWGAWTGCNTNKGRGGTVTAGCLKYSFDTLY